MGDGVQHQVDIDKYITCQYRYMHVMHTICAAEVCVTILKDICNTAEINHLTTLDTIARQTLDKAEELIKIHGMSDLDNATMKDAKDRIKVARYSLIDARSLRNKRTTDVSENLLKI